MRFLRLLFWARVSRPLGRSYWVNFYARGGRRFPGRDERFSPVRRCLFHILLGFHAGAFQRAACALGLAAGREDQFERALRGPDFQISSCDRSLPRDGIALRSPLMALWKSVSALCSREPPLQRSGPGIQRAAARERRAGTREQRALTGEERDAWALPWAVGSLQRAAVGKQRAVRSQQRAGASQRWAGADFQRAMLGLS
jgi:hypothetical protein